MIPRPMNGYLSRLLTYMDDTFRSPVVYGLSAREVGARENPVLHG